MKNIYPKLQPLISKNFSYTVIPEWNEYILKNYCFLEGEEFIISFPGLTYIQNSDLNGWIYLTNYRLINVGTPLKIGPPVFSIFNALISKNIESRRKAIRDSISKLFRKEISMSNIGEWGYVIPIINAYNIKKQKKKISYSINLETGKHSCKFKIKVLPFRAIGQKKRGIY